MCQNYSQKGSPWSNAEEGINFTQPRAFHSMVVVEKQNGEELMLGLGGYTGDTFLDSIEKYEATDVSFGEVSTMKLNESRSHFCSVFYKV